MLKITKDEMNYLQSKGFTFPEDLHKTHTKHITYYVTEGRKIMDCLNKYREKVTLWTK